ncbi:MAG: CPBP family intramembrane glutamic endopeptidase [Actinomycetales bacterium]
MSAQGVSRTTVKWLDGTVRLLAVEVVLVVGLAVGVAAARALVRFAAAVTTPGGLAAQSTTLNGSWYPDRPWLDLAAQLVSIVALVLPAALAVHLALRDGTWADLGLTARRWARDVGVGLGIAAAVGGAGLALYLGSRALGLSLEVQASGLPWHWWTVPVLVLAAGANAVLEEVVVVGYLLRRLEQLGVPAARAAWISAAIRSVYHAYQGVAGLVGNLVMGLLFARWFHRTRRLVPLIVAHWAIDVAAFVGYALLADRVGSL